MGDSKIEITEEHYSNGRLKMQVSKLNGKLHGLTVSWRSNGQLCSRENYDSNLLHGLYEYWDVRGQLRMRRNYFQSALHGLYEYWCLNGQLQERGNYDCNKRHGRFEIGDGSGETTAEYFSQGERITKIEYHKKIQSIAEASAPHLQEKALGLLVAEYCDLLP